MSIKPISTKADIGPHPGEPPSAEQPHGWIVALLGRLGLPGGPTLRETLEDALRGAGDGRPFSAEEREMLLRILHFGTLRVVDVMVPRADIIAVDENEPIWDLLKTFDSAGISRVPLFRETLDDPRGMIHIKDLFRWLIKESAGELLNSPIAVVAAEVNAPARDDGGGMRLSAERHGPLEVPAGRRVERVGQPAFGGNHVAGPGVAPLRLVGSRCRDDEQRRGQSHGRAGQVKIHVRQISA